MRMPMISILCLGMLAMIGCGGAVCGLMPEAPTADSSAPVQKYLFEVEYANRAWGFHHYGIWIDDAGGVWRYDLAEGEGELKGTGPYKGSDLQARYTHKKEYVATIPSDSLRRMSALIAAASLGRSSDTTMPMADAGTVLYRAWKFDAASDTYREVGLRMRGDMHYDNLAPEAAAIADWLETLWENTRR